MNLAIWNVRGLNKRPHQNQLMHFISSNNISFMSCIETKLKVQNSLIISKRINRTWTWIFNYEHHYNDRIWAGNDPTIWNIYVHSKTSQTITYFVTFIEKQIHFAVTFCLCSKLIP